MALCGDLLWPRSQTLLFGLGFGQAGAHLFDPRCGTGLAFLPLPGFSEAGLLAITRCTQCRRKL